jgi:hypothetical protein
MERLDPLALGPADWAVIGRVLTHLVLVVALVVNAAFALLLGYAVLPSLVLTADGPGDLLWLRRVLLPIGLASLALTLLALAHATSLSLPLLQRLYPRFGL